ncbi:MAG: efflux RND transporter periplasmic adaptor subunit [Dehalococcoidia bacterium]|nr:efflux RND transporter periplasmic adaptor subunit [Dehalococcoidia bacterium]
MKKWLSLIIAVCLVGAVFTGCARSQDVTQETAEVIRGDLTISVSVSGNLETPHKTDLSFGTTGMVAEVLVDEGGRVVKGQLLAKLEASSLELSVEMAQARYESAQTDYEIAENKLMQTIYPHYTNTYATDLPGTWLALEEAQDNLKEAQELLEQGKTEEAQALLELVEAGLTKAQRKSQSRTWALPLSVKLAELQTDQAKTALDVAELELAKARVELGKATITASFDGIVTDIYINEGQQLSAMTYANPAICLLDPSEIKMNGVIDEMDISKLKLGQEADIILDALPDKEVKGRVTFISQAGTIQAGVVSYKTTVTLENPDEQLRDGMSASAEIIIDRHKNVLLIPNRAIQGSWDSPWVEVLADEQVEQRPVELSLSDGIKTEVLSGLEEGESVIFPESQLPFRMFGG